MAALFFFTLIAAIPVVALSGPYILRFLLRIAGDSLRRRTRARRQLILERVKVDEERFFNPSSPQRTEDEDWERVESDAASAAVKGVMHQDKDFAGIIGFFHPFWYGTISS